MNYQQLKHGFKLMWRNPMERGGLIVATSFAVYLMLSLWWSL